MSLKSTHRRLMLCIFKKYYSSSVLLSPVNLLFDVEYDYYGKFLSIELENYLNLEARDFLSPNSALSDMISES